jgi:putative transposase
MAIKKEILDELLKDKDPKTMFSSDGLLGELKKALAERVLNAEMDNHLSDSTQEEVSEGDKPANHRNGYSKKTVLTENEALELSIPRDRRGSFEPQLIAKYQRRFPAGMLAIAAPRVLYARRLLPAMPGDRCSHMRLTN